MPVEARVLRIDPTRCEGVGVCAHLAARLITLDDWGFPILATRELTDRQAAAAARAVRACPRRALFLDSAGTDPR